MSKTEALEKANVALEQAGERNGYLEGELPALEDKIKSLEFTVSKLTSQLEICESNAKLPLARVGELERELEGHQKARAELMERCNSETAKLRVS